MIDVEGTLALDTSAGVGGLPPVSRIEELLARAGLSGSGRWRDEQVATIDRGAVSLHPQAIWRATRRGRSQERTDVSP